LAIITRALKNGSVGSVFLRTMIYSSLSKNIVVGHCGKSRTYIFSALASGKSKLERELQEGISNLFSFKRGPHLPVTTKQTAIKEKIK